MAPANKKQKGVETLKMGRGGLMHCIIKKRKVIKTIIIKQKCGLKIK
jgi:hypothetical protein